MANKVLSIADLEEAASKSLSVSARDFFNSGATNQVTLHDNYAAYRKYRLLPRVLRDVSRVNTQISLFDRDITFPLCVSPAGMQVMAHPEGELATSRACAKMGVNMGVSSYANHSVEEITVAGKEVGPIHHVMQLYSMKDKAKQERIVRRAEDAGCKAIFLTADSPVLGVRWNEWRNGFKAPVGLGLPMYEKTSAEIQQQSHDDGFSSTNSDSHSWATEIPWLRSVTKMEIWIKGVLTPEDVETAIEYGCDGIIISNHGGRQLDETPATIDALPACTKAARGRIKIHIDGGIRSGVDIFKALALGAECCWVGRPALWGLAYDGQQGVELMLKILFDDFKRLTIANTYSLRSMQSGKGPLLDENKNYDSEDNDNDFVSRHTCHNKGQRTRPCWSRELRKGICVFVITGLVTCCLRLSHGSPFTEKNPSPHPEAPPLCQSQECIHAASEILYNLDPKYEDIDPCTDFDQYVCGGWREHHDMRPDQGSIFAGTIMEENAQTKLRHILERTEPTESSDADNFKKLKAAYDACLDEATVSKRGSEPLTNILDELKTIYPAKAGLVNGSQDQLTSALLYLANAGVEALASSGVTPDDRDPDNVVIMISPPREIGLPAREYYNNTKTVADYTSVLKQVVRGLAGDGFDKIAEDVVAFEKKLADVTPDTQTQEDVTKYYNPLSIKETEALVPEISFANIISSLAPHDYKTDRLIVGSPSYMKALSVLLKDTPRETILLFLQWKVIQAFADVIEDASIEPLRRFKNVLAGKEPQAKEERWRKCLGHLDEGLEWSLSRFYVLDAFSEDSKKLGDQIVSDIKERFIFTLDQTSWMSPDVRKLGIEKVGNIIQKIGFPTKSPNVLDPEDVKKFYQDLELSKDTFFENEVAVAKFQLRNEWFKLGKPTNRDEWGMSAPTVNAYYNPPGNEIVFPAGIMQPPAFYGPSAPLYLAYGAFGAVSGHELSHAFDSTGRHYDESGNYTNWWDDKTVEAFEERAQCFVDQYSKFTVTGPEGKILHVNGRLTLGENIADAGGLTASYHAWKKHDEAKPDPHLPGLDAFTKEQLFFISYANWWCGKTTKEAAEQAIYNDPHAPKSARIIETMANSREFKNAFSCPDKKPVCKLW
ncbi:Peptidase M13 neprilysin [Penicillium cf. griseofulvum]|uniref:Oxidase FUB9 n=1 Tax=Penicillium cf. griseofulvum TaxID=2972120 RepID=A0A9W9IUG6_9EURO|nr:Peptidase M13 neprilysin [Penicillium cf. griseofulvum]